MKKPFINTKIFLYATVEKQISIIGCVVLDVWLPFKLIGINLFNVIDLANLCWLIFIYSAVVLLISEHKHKKNTHRHYKYRLTRSFNNEIKH
ncbi:hypothetical protein DY048_07675 [Apilactobacillus timberlakei]|uniref:Uncharacterized protein n=1 Tax=Apilactobacillus timberlakei TaxID=2008380 RepID=A0ABY2YVC3_9LACO|nr:hypothetical protein DY048_07675 [Apilactobacillus timberlakei]TPR12961.1 hypothetical protein DY052_08595 [Apilactobacillus timberlakei]